MKSGSPLTSIILLVVTCDAVGGRVRRFACDALYIDVAMGVPAPPHREFCDLAQGASVFDRTVAGGEGSRRGDVCAVVEVHEMGQLMALLPRHRFRQPPRHWRQRLVECQR